MQRHPASVRTLRLSVDSRNVFSVLPRALHVISGSLSCYSSSSATSVSNLAQADASTDGCERFTRFSSVQDAVVCEHRRARRYARVARGHVRDSWWRELLLPAARKIRVRREWIREEAPLPISPVLWLWSPTRLPLALTFHIRVHKYSDRTIIEAIVFTLLFYVC